MDLYLKYSASYKLCKARYKKGVNYFFFHLEINFLYW